MSVMCCGIKYAKNDIRTYWCIDTDFNKPIQKKFIGNNRVTREVVDSCVCIKCGCLIVTISRYGIVKGKKKLLEKEKLKGDIASYYLDKTADVRERQPQYIPALNIPYSKNIDFQYGKVIDSETQRARYLNESGWADKEKIKCKVNKHFL